MCECEYVPACQLKSEPYGVTGDVVKQAAKPDGAQPGLLNPWN